jgi:hypothetical protein
MDDRRLGARSLRAPCRRSATRAPALHGLTHPGSPSNVYGRCAGMVFAPGCRSDARTLNTQRDAHWASSTLLVRDMPRRINGMWGGNSMSSLAHSMATGATQRPKCARQ